MAAYPSCGEHTADSFVFREAVRREKLAARLALDATAHVQLAKSVEIHLAALLLPLPPQIVAFCAPVRGEIDLCPLAGRLIERGWRAAMPAVVAENAPLNFRRWQPSSVMGVDRYNIPVPTQGEPLRPDIVLLPLVAFDARCYRLGYGGGYFDRTLAALVPRPLAIGVGFELARIDDIRPQVHDIALDIVVTEVGAMHRAAKAGLASAAISVNHGQKEESK